MSAFLAVVLSVILLFQSTFYSLTGYAGAEAMLQRMLDQSAYSVLADFDGRVKERYGLYMRYQDGTSLEYQLSDYLQENLGYEAESGLLDIQLQDMETAQQGFSYLSRLEVQILDYCKYRIPAATVEEFLGRADGLFGLLTTEDTEFGGAATDPAEGYDPTKQYHAADYEKYDMRLKAQENMVQLLDACKQDVDIPDRLFRTLPSQKFSDTRNWGLQDALETFLTVDFEQPGTLGTLNQCVDDLGVDSLAGSLWEDYLINEYILSVFNSKTDYNREDFYLKWEVEYILFGNQSDEANANYMKALILLIRFVFNTVYLYLQQDMVATADIASFLATVLVYFNGQPMVKQGILLAWSFAESWHDYDLLEEGKPVPVYKTDRTWKYWTSYDEDAAEKEVSLYYKDYLRIFLLLVPRQVRLARILDLIQLNESQSNASFQVLNSVTQFQVKIICYYDDKKHWSLEAEGSYGY